MSSSTSRLVSGVAHLLDNDKFSDLKIKCEDYQISAHKLVVCTPSDVLHAMCTAGFQESESNTIDLSDDTKCVIYRMVEFLYRGDYQEIDHPNYQTLDRDIVDRSGAHHAMLHASMFAVADKYDIAALGDLAKDKFTKAILNIDNQHYMDVINHVYSTTPESNRGLHDEIGYQTRLRGSTIITDPVLKSRLEEIVSTTPQFAWDLIETSFKPTSAKPCAECNLSIGDKISCSMCVHKNQAGWLIGRPPQSHDIKNAHAIPPSRGTDPELFSADNMTSTFGNKKSLTSLFRLSS